ncbi:hypothetical protein ACA910_004351 [Epithemia clementina (nom. ined.)]
MVPTILQSSYSAACGWSSSDQSGSYVDSLLAPTSSTLREQHRFGFAEDAKAADVPASLVRAQQLTFLQPSPASMAVEECYDQVSSFASSLSSSFGEKARLLRQHLSGQMFQGKRHLASGENGNGAEHRPAWSFLRRSNTSSNGN